ncbi:protein kinase domain-containing protein [Gemmatimonas sp.]|uniref:protein kinase domain-containing protein n=1 Tax=Gemmatimonas sp. TaxID=1962908 RepID=UPI003F6E5E92
MPRSYTAELGTALAGRYLIEEHLGKGGMATVYRARDLKHDRHAALEVLKPENVILQHGQPVVLDFGIALALRNAGRARMTQTGVAMGTPQYMSPEQASGEKQVDARVDIYALGTLFFEMLAGEAPHAGPTPQSVMSRVITTEARSVASVRPLVPAHIAAAIAKALARNPADRFSTVDEFVAALEPSVLHDRGGGPRTDSVSGISASRHGHSTPILLTVALVALALGFFAGRLSTP